MFENTADSSCTKVLLVCAASDRLAEACVKAAAPLFPNAHFTLLLPDRKPETPPDGVEILTGRDENMRPEDVDAAGNGFDCTILIIAHVMRPAYKTLVAACARQSTRLLLFSANGLQPLDGEDAAVSVPELHLRPFAAETSDDVSTWLFFRPSDQSVRALARDFEAEGKRVVTADSLAAFRQALGRCQAVFFDWCLSDYAALARAVAAASEAGRRSHAFLALDLADLAETNETRRAVMQLNSILLPVMERCFHLKTRPFLVERYKLAPERCTPMENIPDKDVWNMDKASPKSGDGPIRIAYHGLFYAWHEVAQFAPVIAELAARTDVRLDLFGRVHESVSFGLSPLFPVTEKKTRRDLDRLTAMPQVVWHGFTPPEEASRAVGAAHFYLGITAAGCLMSKSEMRTGVMEALAVGTPVLHKPTQATRMCGMEPDRDFIAIDALRPKLAAQKILDAFAALYGA